MDTICLEKGDDEINKMYKKVRKRSKRAFSFSEILARIEWYLANKGN